MSARSLHLYARRLIVLVVVAATALATWLTSGPSDAVAASPALNGLSAYTVPAPTGTSFDLPLVAGGNGAPGTLATIVHVANATGTPTSVTITFYRLDGSAADTTGLSLAGNGAADVNVAQVATSGFAGTAVLTAAPNPVGVIVDVIDGDLSTDSLSSYVGVPSGSVASPAFAPSAYNSSTGLSSSFFLRNPSSTTASATLSFTNASGTIQTTRTLPPNGGAVIAASTVGLPPGWLGSVSVTSTPPLTVVELSSSSSFVVEGIMDYGVQAGAASRELAPAVSGVGPRIPSISTTLIRAETS